MTSHKRIKINKVLLNTDSEQFHKLWEILYETTKCNHSFCARILGISRSKWKSWEHNPPSWPWWNDVLRLAIIKIATGLNAKRGMTKQHKHRVMNALSKLPKHDSLAADIEDSISNRSGAEAYLRTLLLGGSRLRREIMTPAECGGYNYQVLDRAAKRMGVIKEQVGFGRDKDSMWRLPREEELVVDHSQDEKYDTPEHMMIKPGTRSKSSDSKGAQDSD